MTTTYDPQDRIAELEAALEMARDAAATWEEKAINWRAAHVATRPARVTRYEDDDAPRPKRRGWTVQDWAIAAVVWGVGALGVNYLMNLDLILGGSAVAGALLVLWFGGWARWWAPLVPIAVAGIYVSGLLTWVPLGGSTGAAPAPTAVVRTSAPQGGGVSSAPRPSAWQQIADAVQQVRPQTAPVAQPVAVPTVNPLTQPTAQILPHAPQPEAVTVVTMPQTYANADGTLYTPVPVETPRPYENPTAIPSDAVQYRLVTPPTGGTCIIVDGKQACDVRADISEQTALWYALQIQGGQMGAPVQDAAPAPAAPSGCQQATKTVDVVDSAGIPIGQATGTGCTEAEAQANADALAAQMRAGR